MPVGSSYQSGKSWLSGNFIVTIQYRYYHELGQITLSVGSGCTVTQARLHCQSDQVALYLRLGNTVSQIRLHCQSDQGAL